MKHVCIFTTLAVTALARPPSAVVIDADSPHTTIREISRSGSDDRAGYPTWVEFQGSATWENEYRKIHTATREDTPQLRTSTMTNAPIITPFTTGSAGPSATPTSYDDYATRLFSIQGIPPIMQPVVPTEEEIIAKAVEEDQRKMTAEEFRQKDNRLGLNQQWKVFVDYKKRDTVDGGPIRLLIETEPPISGLAWQRFNDSQLADMRDKLGRLGDCQERPSEKVLPMLTCQGQSTLLTMLVKDEVTVRVAEAAISPPTLEDNMNEGQHTSSHKLRALITPLLLNDTQLQALQPDFDKLAACDSIMRKARHSNSTMVTECEHTLAHMKAQLDSAAVNISGPHSSAPGAKAYWPIQDTLKRALAPWKPDRPHQGSWYNEAKGDWLNPQFKLSPDQTRRLHAELRKMGNCKGWRGDQTWYTKDVVEKRYNECIAKREVLIKRLRKEPNAQFVGRDAINISQGELAAHELPVTQPALLKPPQYGARPNAKENQMLQLLKHRLEELGDCHVDTEADSLQAQTAVKKCQAEKEALMAELYRLSDLLKVEVTLSSQLPATTTLNPPEPTGIEARKKALLDERARLGVECMGKTFGVKGMGQMDYKQAKIDAELCITRIQVIAYELELLDKESDAAVQARTTIISLPLATITSQA